MCYSRRVCGKCGVLMRLPRCNHPYRSPTPCLGLVRWLDGGGDREKDSEGKRERERKKREEKDRICLTSITACQRMSCTASLADSVQKLHYHWSRFGSLQAYVDLGHSPIGGLWGIEAVQVGNSPLFIDECSLHLTFSNAQDFHLTHSGNSSSTVDKMVNNVEKLQEMLSRNTAKLCRAWSLRNTLCHYTLYSQMFGYLKITPICGPSSNCLHKFGRHGGGRRVVCPGSRAWSWAWVKVPVKYFILRYSMCWNNFHWYRKSLEDLSSGSSPFLNSQ